MNADISPRKRSFFEADDLEASVQPTASAHYGHCVPFVTSQYDRRPLPSPKRRSISYPPPRMMPSETSIAAFPTFPSFMSVFDAGSNTSQLSAGADNRPQQSQQSRHALQPPIIPSNAQTQSRPSLQPNLSHRDSINSLVSNSTESSPTTTGSTFDSPSVTEESPSSSPESPVSSIPLSPFRAMGRSPEGADKWGSAPRPSFLSQQVSLSPQADSPTTSLGRNVKNLSLNVPAAAPVRPATSGGFEGSHPLSAPSSPLQAPLRTVRKRPTNLSIKTPGADQLTFVRTAPDVPPTPGQRPYLQHHQSSPALASMLSPLVLPPGGLHLPLPQNSKDHSRAGSQSSWSTQSIITSLGEVKEEETAQRSQEVQERGYTNGPVQIYDEGVFLYLEPTLEEASRFDTVINVAKEISNPFEKQQMANGTVMSVWRNELDRSKIPEPQTAVSEMSFKSAIEWPQSQEVNATPTTAKPSGRTQSRQPEYLHVPWDHNSEIVEDLYPLCKLIDNRVSSGRTVLVHCQLGVSRSASLVIAYGLYKGYQSSFHTMYGAVKAKSRWVGPNMSLIYQLGDFRSQFARGDFANKSGEAPEHWFKLPPNTGDLKTPTNPPSVSKPKETHIVRSGSKRSEPSSMAKPLPPLRLNKQLPPIPPFPQDFHTRLSKPLPSPAPKVQSSTSSKMQPPRPLPLREQYPIRSEIPPHRPRNRPGFAIVKPSAQMDLAKHDVPTTPSLFSPRATEFIASPFGATLAGDLHAGPTTGSQPSQPAVDPRSPHQRDDTGEIVRHIDEFL